VAPGQLCIWPSVGKDSCFMTGSVLPGVADERAGRLSCNDILHHHPSIGMGHVPHLDEVLLQRSGAALGFNTHVERSGVPDGG